MIPILILLALIFTWAIFTAGSDEDDRMEQSIESKYQKEIKDFVEEQQWP